MASIETNIFALTNLADLSSSYKLYRVRGLSLEQAEYYQNSEAIKRTLSYRLQSPVTLVERDGAAYLVLRDDAPEPPASLALVRSRIKFEREPGAFQVDYTQRTPENDAICLRFINFTLHAALRAAPDLWSPGAGRPFFQKKPVATFDRTAQYRGYVVRAVRGLDQTLGICVDVVNKYVSTEPLPTVLSRDYFASIKGLHFVYHYGHAWFDIVAHGLSDLRLDEYDVPRAGGWISLTQWIVDDCAKPITPELADLQTNSSVILYRNNRGEERAAPSPLCYRTYGTDDPAVAKMHVNSILQPADRRSEIRAFAGRYLAHVRFGRVQLKVSPEPQPAPYRVFPMPDLAFGNGAVLSVRGTPGARHVSLDRVGRERLNLLRDPTAGFYERPPLYRQYLFLPVTVAETYGPSFVHALSEEVSTLYSTSAGAYRPVVVTYHDRCPKTFAHQARAIAAALEQRALEPGYAVVMIHTHRDRALREEDALAALVIRKLKKRDIVGSVIHTDVSRECYEAVQQQGKLDYRVKPSKARKWSGYLRNVALTKVLLTNRAWPYVLATRLNADITIGLDVKNNVLGIVIVAANGRRVRWDYRPARQGDHLSQRELQTYLAEVLRDEARHGDPPPQSVVIHRDGRLFPSEREGLMEAFRRMKIERLLPSEADLTLVEIPKSAAAPLRMFQVSNGDPRAPIENPEVGQSWILDNEGYLCATGRAFHVPGTAQPLHVRRVSGALPMEALLDDVYALTVLASWTRPEGCVRDPVTVKLNDRFLVSEAGTFDEQAPELLDDVTEQENDT